ncbi:MAG: hypothetical protein K8F54_06260 [Altibacter sp.]|uniref:hypothetical protein n=1 Tax=Altibacter sp. TaxID=2024823 RepID=UPI001DD0DF84|nr:hypothetical protein [Altibacter sp.]MBZ0327191.1 hypothetical protein [Altibacter sp.]
MRVALSILFIIFGFTNGISQTGIIRGKVIAEVKADFDFIKENIQVLICTGCEEFSTHLDENLNFEFHNVRTGAFEIWIEPHSTYTYDFKSGNLKKDEIFEIEIPVAFSCVYDQSENDKTCPICRKQNRVIPIRYGLVIGNGAGRKYRVAGCIRTDCDPNWYCKRDKIEF